MTHNNRLDENLLEITEAYRSKPVIVHSDLFMAARFVVPTTNRHELLDRHKKVLAAVSTELLIPAFNYQYPKTRTIDLQKAPVELGPLNEFMLRNWAGYRSFDPIFSFASKKYNCSVDSGSALLHAFGEKSDFAKVVNDGGAILLYGAPLSSLTMIHHAEVKAGMPLYRYDKDFEGTVNSWEGVLRAITYRYHVRPMGRCLDYDWGKLESLLQEKNLIKPLYSGNQRIAMLIPADDFIVEITDILRKDPLYLLNSESRAWVEPLLDKLGRRFILEDFEI